MQSSNICFLAVCAFVLISSINAAPLDDSQHATILRYDNDNIGTDGYNFKWVVYLNLKIRVFLLLVWGF